MQSTFENIVENISQCYGYAETKQSNFLEEYCLRKRSIFRFSIKKWIGNVKLELNLKKELELN